MICTAKPLTQNKSSPHQELNTTQRRKLVSRWKTVGGKLTCQWVKE